MCKPWDNKSTACRVALVAQEFLRMLHACGMPATDADLINGRGTVVNQVLLNAGPRSTLFTGSSKVAEKLAVDLHGKVSRTCRAL